MTLETAIKFAEEAGFTHTAPMEVSSIELKPEVRDMCQACHQYAKRWSCPPGCGSLAECSQHITGYRWGILVQTVGELEDELDGESMMEAESLHKEHFQQLYERLRTEQPNMLALGAGCCRQCSSCTYPDEPCRFPEKMISSMEAYGIVVMEVCKANNLPYYYGPCTIAYTSCFLFP